MRSTLGIVGGLLVRDVGRYSVRGTSVVRWDRRKRALYVKHFLVGGSISIQAAQWLGPAPSLTIPLQTIDVRLIGLSFPS